MNKKSLLNNLIVLLAAFALLLSPVLAKNDNAIEVDIPDQDGIYDVPGHQELKLRVIVHKEKPAKTDPEALQSFVCTLSDPDSLSFIGATGWYLATTTPFVYTLNPSSVPASIGASNLPKIAENSFKVWTDAIGNKVTISRNPINTLIAKKALDGKNIIAWNRLSKSILGVTYTWYYTSTGLVAEIDTIMNKSVAWSWSNPTTWPLPYICADKYSYDAQNILTHEIGHWFGLIDRYETDYAANTMYGYGSKMETKKDTLTEGDILGVEAIY
ncbi:MAG: hypothetical protein HY764_03535 [Candidatus Portnoybacteria bacterium]|nr:hypothetical protein [Candidatus Portnoybacteria bacterium]